MMALFGGINLEEEKERKLASSWEIWKEKQLFSFKIFNSPNVRIKLIQSVTSAVRQNYKKFITAIDWFGSYTLIPTFGLMFIKRVRFHF